MTSFLHGLTICAMTFGTPAPVADYVLNVYAEAYGCSVEQEQFRDPRQLTPISQVGSYFQRSLKGLPVIDGMSQDMSQLVRDFLRNGIRPALLLPQARRDKVVDFQLFAEFRALQRDGALIIMPLQRPYSDRLPIEAAYFSAFGVPPQGVLLTDGLSSDLLPRGTGLQLISGFFWQHSTDIPIPARKIAPYVYPYFETGIAGGGERAFRVDAWEEVSNQKPLNPARLQGLPLDEAGLNWTLWGGEFRTDTEGFSADPWGHVIMSSLPTLYALNSLRHRAYSAPLNKVISLFSWTALVAVVLTFVLLIIGQFRMRRSRNG